MGIEHLEGKRTGRPKGVPNKLTMTVREAFQRTFNELQGIEGACLTDWAIENKTDFYKISSKLIPQDVALQGGLTLQVITGVPDATNLDANQDSYNAEGLV